VVLQSERGRCQYSSVYVIAAIMWLRREGRKFVRLALKFFMKNNKDFVDVILL
jgi:hypothetical protein